MCGGSGGGSNNAGGSAGSGTVQYEEYLTNLHERIMNLGVTHSGDAEDPSMENALFTLWDGSRGTDVAADNPYDTIVPFDPDALLTDSQTRFEIFDTEVTALNPLTNWDTHIDGAETTVDTDILIDSKARDYVTTLITALNALAPSTDWNAYIDAAFATVDTDVLPDAEARTYIDTLVTAIAALAPTTDWAAFVTAAVAQIATVWSTAYIDNAVAEFEASQQAMYQRGVDRLSAGLVDINAVCSSQFFQSQALLQHQLQQQSADFETKLRLQADQRREAFVAQAIDAMKQLQITQTQAKLDAYGKHADIGFKRGDLTVAGTEQMRQMQATQTVTRAQAYAYHVQVGLTRAQLISSAGQDLARHHFFKVEKRHAVSNLCAEINRVAIVAKKEESDRQDDYDLKSATWNVELLNTAATIFAAIHGAVGGQIKHPGSATNSGIGGQIAGGLGGAASGGMAGFAVGGPIGAMLGGTIGGIGGFMSAD